jgi:hypothetical protein
MFRQKMPPAVTNVPLWMNMKTPHAAQSMATTRPEDKSFKKRIGKLVSRKKNDSAHW